MIVYSEDFHSINLQDYPHLKETIEFIFPSIPLTFQQKIVQLVTQTCPYCFSTDRNCKCWNGE